MEKERMKRRIESGIDPIFASVLQRRFKSITEEMGLTLLRTSRSPILNEARDFVTGLYDAEGNMLEQTEYIPILAFALAPVCKRIVESFESDLYPGDVILHNDVYTEGNQLADVAVFRPVFWKGELFGWAAVKGHQADIGGDVAGGYNPDAREVWQEGIRIPPVKVYEKGRLRKDVWDLIFSNIRYPIVAHDIRAQIGGTALGERGLLKLLETHGARKLKKHISFLFDSAEKMVRKSIREIRNGLYHGESTVYYDGVTPGSEMAIRVTIRVEDEDVYYDYTGTDRQTPGFVNAPLASTVSAVVLTFLMLVDPGIPHNAGLLRPLHINVPEGTFLNVAYPGASTFGNTLCGPNSDAIFSALAPGLPRQVTSGWNRALNFAVTGQDPRRGEPYVDILFNALKGGSGACYGFDGYSHIGLINCAGGILAQDPEMFEHQDPHLLIHHEYLPGSAGAGQWRGGFGVESVIQFQGENTRGVTFGDGVDEGARAFGLFGGKRGSINSIEITHPDGTTYHPTSKEVINHIPTGSIFRQKAGGGGGYGDPFDREGASVLRDVKDGLISIEEAGHNYGVVIDPVTLEIDAKKTLETRRKAG
jgi:N-methylhydantoinase B